MNGAKEYIAQYWKLILILLLTVISYSRTFENDFVHWDDIDQIVDNKEIRSLTLSNIKKMFTTSYVSMYQPLVTLSFAVEYALAGPDPRLFHLTNLLFHLANVVLLFLLIQRLFHHHGIALFVALIFAIHPMHVESVAWVTERKDVLYAFFYFLALLNFLRFQDNNSPGFYWLSLGFFTLSLLSKSAAVTLPLLLLLLHWYRQQPWEKRLLLRYLPFFALALLFGIISLLTQKPQDNTPFFQSYSTFDRLFLSLYPIAFYAVKYFIPVNLCVFHPLPTKINGFLPWEYYAAPLLIALMLLPVLKQWKLQRLAQFALAFFFLHILLYLHLFPVGSAVVAERYTYIAYIGISILIAHTVTLYAQQFQWLKKLILPALVVLSALFASISYHRVLLWNNTISLFQDALNKTGSTICTTGMLALGYHAQAKAFMVQKDYERAIDALNSAAQYDPTLSEIYYDRGVCLMKVKEYSYALEDFNRALACDTAFGFVYAEKGLVHLRLQQYDSALVSFNKSLQFDSTSGRTYGNRGIVYVHLNNINAACADFRKALAHGFKDVEPLIEKYCGKQTR